MVVIFVIILIALIIIGIGIGWVNCRTIVEDSHSVTHKIVRCSCGSNDVFVSQLKPDVYWCRNCRNMWTTQVN